MNDFTSTGFYGDDESGDLRGPKGEPGDTGKQGDVGPRGDQGEQGIRGPAASDGADGKNAVYRFGTFAVSGIQASEILMDHIVAQACTLGVGFAGSVASCGSPPEALWTAPIALNETAVGYLEVTSDGVATLTALTPDPIPLVVGDVVSLTAPEEPDLEIGRVRITLTGEL